MYIIFSLVTAVMLTLSNGFRNSVQEKYIKLPPLQFNILDYTHYLDYLPNRMEGTTFFEDFRTAAYPPTHLRNRKMVKKKTPCYKLFLSSHLVSLTVRSFVHTHPSASSLISNTCLPRLNPPNLFTTWAETQSCRHECRHRPKRRRLAFQMAVWSWGFQTIGLYERWRCEHYSSVHVLPELDTSRPSADHSRVIKDITRVLSIFDSYLWQYSSH